MTTHYGREAAWMHWRCPPLSEMPGNGLSLADPGNQSSNQRCDQQLI